MKKIIVMLLAVLSASTAAIAQKPAVMLSGKPGWHKIATNKVSYKTDRDEVLVLGEDHFKKLKLVAKNEPVDLMAFEVYYQGENNPQAFSMVENLKSGVDSKEFVLEGKEKAIKKIVLVYKAVPVRKNEKESAEVEIWGLK